MKNAVLVIVTGLLIVTNFENVKQDAEMEAQATSYESRLEIQKAEYVDTIIDLQQELRVTQFERDMAIDHIELVNAGY